MGGIISDFQIVFFTFFSFLIYFLFISPQILENVPTLTLPPTSVDVLLTFFCDRMSDLVCTEEIIRGVTALVKQDRLPLEGLVKVFFFYLFCLSDYIFYV
jgi:hypothetical protein